MICCRAADETGELAVKDRKKSKVAYLISSPTRPLGFQVDSVSSYWWLAQRSQNGLEVGGGGTILLGLLRTQAVSLTLAITSFTA